MAIEDWPADFCPQQMEWRLRDSSVAFRSPFSGTLQTASFVGEHWTCEITMPPKRADGGLLDVGPKLAAFLHWWKGGVNQVRVYDWKYPSPRGSISGSPTLQTGVVRGNNTIILTVGSGQTIFAGDKFSLGGQWFETKNDATAAGTLLTIATVNRVRATINAGAAVTLIRPTINMIMPEVSAGVLYTPGQLQPATLHIEEAP